MPTTLTTKKENTMTMKIFVVVRDNGDRAEHMAEVVRAFVSEEEATSYALDCENEARKTKPWTSYDVYETELKGN